MLNVGIIGDRIAAVGTTSTVNPANAAAVRDCTGLIVDKISQLHTDRQAALKLR